MKDKIYSVLVDDEDLPKLNHGKCWKTNGLYVYITYPGQKLNTLIHRVIMNAPKHLTVDHINRNRFDNRKCNLRLCTLSQNHANRPPKNQFKGVRYIKNKTCRPWIANISSIYVGAFDTAEEAARAYDDKAREIYGEFAWLNFKE